MYMSYLCVDSYAAYEYNIYIYAVIIEKNATSFLHSVGDSSGHEPPHYSDIMIYLFIIMILLYVQ